MNNAHFHLCLRSLTVFGSGASKIEREKFYFNKALLELVNAAEFMFQL